MSADFISGVRRNALRLCLACGLAAMLSDSLKANLVLYSDSFDNGGTANQTFDGSSTPEVNLIGASNVLQQYGSGTQLNHVDRWKAAKVGGIGGISWGAGGTRYNWATGAYASQIATGGLKISGEMRTGNGGDFLAFGFGMSGADPTSSANFGTVYADTSADWGFRLENDRMITFDGGTTTPRYRTDVDPGAYNFGNFDSFYFELDLTFDDGNFDAGSTVTASLYLDDLNGNTRTFTNFDTWTLQNTDDFIIDMAYHVTTSGEGLLYDIAVSTAAIPEASSVLCFGLISVGLVWPAMIRRRAVED